MSMESVCSSFPFSPSISSLTETLYRRLFLSSASDHYHHNKYIPTEQSLERSNASFLSGNDRPKTGIDLFTWTKLASCLHQHMESSNGFFDFIEIGSVQSQETPLLCLSIVSDDVRSHKIETHRRLSVHAAKIEPPRQQEDPEKNDFYVNIGYAIQTLQDEMPSLFYRDLTYDIYREDIILHVSMHIFSGINNYKFILRALRTYGRMFFKVAWLYILRITQPSENVILIRWQIRGIARIPWDSQGIFDGTSEYMLDQEGKIYEHKIDNMERPRFKMLALAEKLNLEVSLSTLRPMFFFKNATRDMMKH